MENDINVSLYEYLGYAAGPSLGQVVYQTAKQNYIRVTSHEVHTKTYKGKILRYPKSFLINYFKSNPTSI